jgi:aminomethyltransferase
MNQKEHFRTAVHQTPFHPRTSALNKLNVWHRWKDYTVSDAYYNVALEYAAIRNACAGVRSVADDQAPHHGA